MNLSSHFAVWFPAMVVVALAAPLVRAYAAHLERRTREGAERVVARLSARASAQEVTRDSAGSAPHTPEARVRERHEAVTESRTT